MDVNISFLSIPWGLLEDVSFQDQTSAVYTGYPLRDNAVYEWDVFDSRYMMRIGTSAALSFPQYYTTFGISSNNGAFYFYTDFSS